MRFPVWLMACAVLFSCSSVADFVEVHDMKGSRWETGATEYFRYDNRDTLQRKDLSLILRYSDSYSYEGLHCRIEILAPGRKTWCDTLSLVLADTSGTFRGEHKVFLYNLEQPVIRKALFREQGGYLIMVRPLSEVALEGVVSIGIAINNSNRNGKE